jgi:hypothetical protein
MELSLLELKLTAQSAAVSAADPGRMVPKSVTPDVWLAHPVASSSVSEAMVTVTVVVAVAAKASVLPASIASSTTSAAAT